MKTLSKYMGFIGCLENGPLVEAPYLSIEGVAEGCVEGVAGCVDEGAAGGVCEGFVDGLIEGVVHGFADCL
mgnify:CR=1 FL=1